MIDDAGESEDDTMIDVVDIIKEIWWENKPEWESVDSFIPMISYIYYGLSYITSYIILFKYIFGYILDMCSRED